MTEKQLEKGEYFDFVKEAAGGVNEKELLLKFSEAKAKLIQKKEELSTAQAEFDEIENQLIETLQAEGKEATARYDNLGYATLVKPALYASVTKENEGLLFSYLEFLHRTDLIKQTIHPRSLSSFVKELLEVGKEIPPYISYYLKPSIRLIPGGAK